MDRRAGARLNLRESRLYLISFSSKIRRILGSMDKECGVLKCGKGIQGPEKGYGLR